jgi:hypothetical protein
MAKKSQSAVAPASAAPNAAPATAPQPPRRSDALVVRGAREHNLRNISVTIPRDQLTVVTGLSGSGKSSLAFDTIYAEGQRRYVESLSAYARQFLGLMEKPDVDAIEGLSPAISIEQKSAGHNPALDGRHRHGDLRLSPPAVRTHRNAALPQLWPCGAASESGANCRAGTGLAGWHPARNPCAAGAGKKR